MKQDHLLDKSLDMTHILELAKPAIENGDAVEINLPIVNTNRVVGTITGAEISRRHGLEGLAEDTVKINLTGSAGQSLGAFCPKGMTFTVEGDGEKCSESSGDGKVTTDDEASLVSSTSVQIVALVVVILVFLALIRTRRDTFE